MDIALITIVYNGYGEFLKGWFENAFQQTLLPKEIVVVLGKGHKMEIKRKDVVEEGKKIGVNVKFIEKRKKIAMGTLKNIAFEHTTAEWVLYFSADDVLLPCALEQVERGRAIMRSGERIIQEADGVALKFFMECYHERQEMETPIPQKRNFDQWRKLYRASGYVALKRSVWEGAKYDDNDYPNFPFLFKLIYQGRRFTKTSQPCAVYLRRPESHSNIKTEADIKTAGFIIDEAAKLYGK